jgi:hypothetical protein
MKRVVLWFIALSLVASAAFGQSLAEVARKEAERRKAIKNPAKVQTDEDLKRYGPVTPPAQAEQKTPPPATEPAQVQTTQPGLQQAGKAAGEAAAETQEPAKDEAWWRDRITSARAALEQSKLLADALQSRINALTNDFASRDDPAQRAVIANDRVKALGELERMQKQIESDTKAITDIEKEARIAGVPPGWLR